MHLAGGRRWYVKADGDEWLWRGDSLAALRGALRVPDPRNKGRSFISLLVEADGVVGVPREFPIEDEPQRKPIDGRYLGPRTNVVFRDRSDLRKNTTLDRVALQHQVNAATALAEGRGGYVVMPPGGGKTVVGVRAICQVRRRALIVVNTLHLQHQWTERLRDFTTLDEDEVGVLQGAASMTPQELQKPVAVAMAQTLNHVPFDHPVFRSYGVVILDEAHEAPAVVVYSTVLKFSARYLWAMTATADRTDGLWPLVPWVVGRCAYEVKPTEFPTIRLLYTETPEYPVPYGSWLRDENGDVVPMLNADGEPVIRDGRPVGQRDPHAYHRRGRTFWPMLLNYLVDDKHRNLLLAREIERCVKAGRNVIMLTDRRRHVRKMARLLRGKVDKVGQILADTPMAARKQMGKDCRVILATMGCLKKGADFPRFDTLAYGCPLSSAVSMVQTAGRVFSRGNAAKKKPLLIVPFDKRVGASAGCTSSFVRKAAQMGWTTEGG